MPASSKKDYFRVCFLAFKVLLLFMTLALFLIWLNQRSINLYFEQKYHKGSPLQFLENNDFWNLGEQLNDRVVLGKNLFVNALISEQPAPEPEMVARKPEKSPVKAPPARIEALEKIPVKKEVTDEKKVLASVKSPAADETEEAAAIPEAAELDKGFKVVLTSEQKVLFVGDSLMQGVAPYIMNTLRKDSAVRSINLSKQSTGLSYPGFYNWPAMIENALLENKDIGLIVMMLGPNDPWDMPGEKGKPYLKFMSEDWELVYRKRVESILSLAEHHGVRVIWVGAPVMRKKKLSEGMAYLNAIFKDEVEKNNGIYLDANPPLGYGSMDYDSHVTVDEQKIKVRTDDGIHFTPIGQKRIAAAVLSLIFIKAQDEPESAQ